MTVGGNQSQLDDGML